MVHDRKYRFRGTYKVSRCCTDCTIITAVVIYFLVQVNNLLKGGNSTLISSDNRGKMKPTTVITMYCNFK